ncbi:large conductance mechanosensitive channel protein MscL [Texas Phoenix palm phytoplasma]|uniref:Large conductance mechanosensitive channel protein MscL n=1 Tax=Texas Phoenix palm phytoplasma TaxID=176709 RepID=A0ABS5BIX4_9MOLU|nr:large conductance mechanosensitive channel protein MscL [Texas Phoenix palm phytoplasma]MBP3059541.1 large conductance mechanosensitive channel protein MscL [Texas Phoenix palm phytoplasma]
MDQLIMTKTIDLQKINNFKEGFKKFINKGDVIKLSVAFILSQLFSKIVTSLTSDIIMPPINLLFSKTYSLKGLRLHLSGDIFINYGNFIQSILEFLMVSFIFYVIFSYINNKISKEENKNQEIIKNEQLEAKQKLENMENEKIQTLKEIKNLLKNRLN